MKPHLTQLLTHAVETLCRRGVLQPGDERRIHIERARDSKHGDFASNLAMALAKSARLNPRELAAQLVDALPESKLVERVEIAAPGFINFFIKTQAHRAVIDDIRTRGAQYGCSDAGAGKSVLIEFVSANPTGPLHVGHGRGAAFGDALARVLQAVGWRVEREYYVNDAGRQIDILALSVWLRYLMVCGESIAFPDNAYRGAYIADIAAALHQQHSDAWRADGDALCANLPDDDETRIDEMITRCKTALGEIEQQSESERNSERNDECAPKRQSKQNVNQKSTPTTTQQSKDASQQTAYQQLLSVARDTMVDDIRDDLAEFGVQFDRWFSERALVDGGAVERALDALARGGYLYEQDGATWFAATRFGDAKDRAVLRADGSRTYFAADIAYHFTKGERGFDQLIDVFGADHHGYARRITAAFAALGFDEETLHTPLVQFAALYRGGEKISMSTRGGEFVTLRQLRREVGDDAARFFYVSRKNDQHMEFDLDLAKAQSSDNPVYYVQYAHARICSVFRQLREKNIPHNAAPDTAPLTEPGELELMKTLSRFPEVVETAASTLEPHLIAYYLRELATEFHAYYNAHPFLSSADEVRAARLGLIDAVRQVIANGLGLLGVGAPQQMGKH